MSILSGWLKTRAYRKTADGYKKESRDTSSETVFMNDGNTAETNLGAIKGITDSLTATSSNVALSAKGGNNLQGQINTLNNDLGTKQNLLEAGRYTGNIDAVGASGIRENSICWINSTNASGNQPIKGYYMLKTFLDGIGNISQKAICYTGESPLIKERIYCNGSWSDWTLPPASLNDLIPYTKASDVEANYAKKTDLIPYTKASDVEANYAKKTDLIPYAKTQDINDGLNVRQKLFYNDTNKSLLGITSDTTINQVVDGMMLPEYSELTLWINDDTVIGRTVRNNINETHNVKPFGYLTIKRFDQVIKLYFEDYGSTDIYLNSYTSINSQGWSADWVKK